MADSYVAPAAAEVLASQAAAASSPNGGNNPFAAKKSNPFAKKAEEVVWVPFGSGSKKAEMEAAFQGYGPVSFFYQ